MGSNILLVLCIFIWGTTTFLQKLSAEKMSPVLMQIVVGLTFLAFIPIAIRMEGGWGNLRWNAMSIVLTMIATAMAITGNILLYTALKANTHVGSSVMLVSLYPVVTLILSAIFLHEQFSPGKLLGILVMIGGACLLTFC